MNEETQQSRSTLAVALLGAVPFLVLAAWHWQYGPLAQFGDWAQYLLHADALRHGRSYGDIGYIFTSRNPFIGPPVQPPGLPAALVPLLVLTDGARDSAVYKLFMVACTLAFLGAVAAYFTRHSDRLLAIATILATGLWIETGYATNAVQPDVGFCAFVWAIFCLADRPGRWSWGRVVAITVFGLAALAFRLAALPLVPAVALYAAMRRRELGTRPFVPVLVWSLCGAAAVAASPGSLTFARLVPHDPGVLARAIMAGVRIYPFAALDLFLYPFPWNRVNDAYHMIIALLALIGAVAWVPRLRSRFSILFAVLYVGLLLVLPMQDTRYLMPLAPLAVFFAAAGIGVAVSAIARLTRRDPSRTGALRVSLAVVVAIVAVSLGRELSRPAPVVLMDAPGVSRLFARLRAARDSTPVRAVFMNPRVLTWETGVPAMGFFLAAPDTTIDEFRTHGITHVVVGDLDTDVKRAHSIRSAVFSRPDLFARLYAAGPFTVYAFDSTRAPRP